MNTVQAQIRHLSKKLTKLTQAEQKLRERKTYIIHSLGNLHKTLALLKGKKLILSIKDGKMETFLLAQIDENTKLGDAIEAILFEYGPLYRKEIIKHLRNHRVRISPKAPEQVLANAIGRDKQERFVIRADRRIDLKYRSK